MDIREEALKLHREKQGKIEVVSKVEIKDGSDLALAYTPGVAEPCKEIAKDESLSYTYTNRGNMIAVVTDGSAVLGLGNIGASAGMPVMEGKCVLFKEYGNVDAFPICLKTQDPDEIVNICKNLEPSFGGINLEDISAPNCFIIEERLKKELDIPVFHDDQHGTAIITLAAVINALRVVKKEISDVKIVLSGAGAAGIAISKLLMDAGAKHILLTSRHGILTKDNAKDQSRKEIAEITNKENREGSLADALVGADVFIGVSAPNLVTKEMVKTMNKDAIVLAMANPIPEIYPDEAKAGGARVVGTGRSDFPNQVNNVLVFPGIFRGTLDVRAKEINTEMKLAAAHAIANMVKEDELNEDFILPLATNKEVGKMVSEEVKKAAIKTGASRI
ncbi:NADP-dependent malic enzyme [Citroniella saccharovorans]|uniref:NADP-dependent malic enzyme n=1 Tax=Citroniella saccharovorans TaxID=2053367 RepID=A0AAW9MX74_9FIRM|nr:NADP-dependent malic enzyme [Citroniella saccharovorans]MEB3428637.1 NADP-dependent malic enzyme [Citroniella saccharovorans]